MIEQLEGEKRRRSEQVQQAQADLARQAALIRDLQAHRSKPHPKTPGVAPEQVCLCTCAVRASSTLREYMINCITLVLLVSQELPPWRRKTQTFLFNSFLVVLTSDMQVNRPNFHQGRVAWQSFQSA